MNLVRKFPLTLLWVIFIFMLCALRISDIPGAEKVKIPNFDKVVHGTFFFVLSLLIYFESRRQHYYSFTRRRWTFVIICIGLVYGGAIELIQKYFFPYRSADWFDFMADAVGCFFAIILMNLFFKESATPRKVK